MREHSHQKEIQQEMSVEVQLQQLGIIRDYMEGTAKLGEPILKQFLLDVSKTPLFPPAARQYAMQAFMDTCDLEEKAQWSWAELADWAEAYGYELVAPADRSKSEWRLKDMLALKSVIIEKALPDGKTQRSEVLEPVKIPEYIRLDVRDLLKRRNFALATIAMISGNQIWEDTVRKWKSESRSALPAPQIPEVIQHEQPKRK
jgi:hypothetical protein